MTCESVQFRGRDINLTLTTFAVVLDPDVLELVTRRLPHLTHVPVVLAVVATDRLAAHTVAVGGAVQGALAPRLLPVLGGQALRAELTHLAFARVAHT